MPICLHPPLASPIPVSQLCLRVASPGSKGVPANGACCVVLCVFFGGAQVRALVAAVSRHSPAVMTEYPRTRAQVSRRARRRIIPAAHQQTLRTAAAANSSSSRCVAFFA